MNVKLIILVFCYLIMNNFLNAQCTSPVTINGRSYKTILIGSQCWLAENLKEKNYTTGDSKIYYEGNSEITAEQLACFEAKYGRLYNWDAAVSVDNAISGWHLPTEAEINKLLSTVGSDAVNKLKEGGSSGFEGLFSGVYNDGGTVYSSLGNTGSIWTSTTFQYDNTKKVPFIIYASKAVSTIGAKPTIYISVRLIKD